MKFALVFHTTHQTMLAEEVLSLNKFFFDTLPIPKDIKAGCTISLSVRKEDIAGIFKVFKNENIVVEGLYCITKDGWKREKIEEETQRAVYFDHNATTPVAPEAANAMLPFLEDQFGNPSSIHSVGREARLAVDEAREKVAAFLGADIMEIVFTGCGSESSNLAIKGTAFNRPGLKGHIITSLIEHLSVLYTCRYLQKIGFDVTYLTVDKYGLIDLDDLKKALRKDTFLITVHWANNEVGTIEPVNEIGGIARENGILFHTDAVQAVGKIPIDVGDMPIDMLSFSAHKFYGPKGVGGLYVKGKIRPVPIIHGGKHEKGMRAGTENVPGIVGMAAAAMVAMERIHDDSERLLGLRDMLYNEIVNLFPDAGLNGHKKMRLPNTVNMSFPGIDGESFLINLDLEGIKVSTGSACASGSTEPSHVLKAMGVPEDMIRGSIRFSLGRDTTEEDVKKVAKTVGEVVKRMRR